uniref:Uncharacterized protein n=1 Tax=Anguilla anguilla TaxID=7936 RepID=A0A0E9WTY2_ANGAN
MSLKLLHLTQEIRQDLLHYQILHWLKQLESIFIVMIINMKLFINYIFLYYLQCSSCTLFPSWTVSRGRHAIEWYGSTEHFLSLQDTQSSLLNSRAIPTHISWLCCLQWQLFVAGLNKPSRSRAQ